MLYACGLRVTLLAEQPYVLDTEGGEGVVQADVWICETNIHLHRNVLASSRETKEHCCASAGNAMT